MSTKKQMTSQIIFHIDGDAFFASCEQSTRLDLRGRAIAVGRERGVATAFSYEAKALGITRGMSGAEVARSYPEVLLVSSDYRKYGLFSARMQRIVGRYTDQVEQTSIDECFADMSEVVPDFSAAQVLASKLQDQLCLKLGLTISIGIGPNKTIAKIASGMHKPRGITCLAPDFLQDQLYPLDIAEVSGIGTRSVPKFHACRIRSIGDFANCSPVWVQEHFAKPYYELYRELRGEYLRELETETEAPKSISKIRAFAPATTCRDTLYSELVRNAEIAAAKLGRYRLQAKRVVFRLKERAGGRSKQEVTPEYPICSTQDITSALRAVVSDLFVPGVEYRATQVELQLLSPIHTQESLFDSCESVRDEHNNLGEVLSTLNNRFGNSTLTAASGLISRARLKAVDITGKSADSQEGTPLITHRETGRALYLPSLGQI